MQHGVSQHLVWILQCIYYGQSGKVREHFVDSRDFGIHAGVRQGCVLSPRLFCAVLEFAMPSWRAKIESYGLNLHDGMKALLDLRFADDLLVFATSRDDTTRLLEELGPSWFNTEHVENKNFDYTSSTRKFLADKWWGDGGNTG